MKYKTEIELHKEALVRLKSYHRKQLVGYWFRPISYYFMFQKQINHEFMYQCKISQLILIDRYQSSLIQ